MRSQLPARSDGKGLDADSRRTRLDARGEEVEKAYQLRGGREIGIKLSEDQDAIPRSGPLERKQNAIWHVSHSRPSMARLTVHDLLAIVGQTQLPEEAKEMVRP